MKLKFILACSFLANVVLIGWLCFADPKHPTPAAPVSWPAVDSATTKPTAPLRHIKKTPPASPAAPASSTPDQSFDWRMVESDNYKNYIANLRSIGCPEETIRDIITADVNKLFESRGKQLSGSKTNRFEYWKTGNVFAGMLDEAKLEQQQALSKERRALLKELLGVEPEEKPDMSAMMGGFNPLESMLDFLSPSQQTQVMEVEQKFAAKLMKSFDGGAPDAEGMKEMLKVQREKEAELAKILSPAEFEDYQLRMSQTAMMMRMQLTSFEPTEQEFRDIFKLKKSFDDEYGPYGLPGDKAERQKRDASQKALDDQLTGLLGQPRYEEYKRSQDHTYQAIAKVAARENLPKESALKVYDMKKIAEDQAKQLRTDKSLSTEQRQQALRAIRSETEASVKQVFGEKGFENFRRQPGAYWLKNLSPDQDKP